MPEESTISPRQREASGAGSPAGQGLVWALDKDISQPRVVSEGRDVVFVSGWCYHRVHPIRRMAFILDGVEHRVWHHGLNRPDVLQEQVREGDRTGNSFFSGFWVTLAIPASNQRRRVPLALRATLRNGQEVLEDLGELSLVPHGGTVGGPGPAAPVTDEPVVAICLATYNPPLDLLTQQIDSLLAQTYRNWICIVNDDHSAPALFAGLQRLVGRDPRFRVDRNARRLGVYRNFERCLVRVPPEASLVAFCDQDDLWYADKLSSSLAAFRDDVSLVYSDMHIVDRDGRRLSDTYWTTRRNNHTDLAALLFANTVTGAASVFRSELLPRALPFPEPIGDSFHDHWVACVALAGGRIAYVDRPLYAYRQHAGNVIGHYTAQGFSVLPRASKVLRTLRSPTALKQSARVRLRMLHHGYRLLTRVVLMARTLEVRLAGKVSPPKQTILSRLARMERSVWPLVGETLRCWVERRSTLGLEFLCLRSAAAMRLSGAYYRSKQKQIHAQAVANSGASAAMAGAPSAAAAGEAEAKFLVGKTAPLRLVVSTGTPRRVNVVTSTVDFRYLFAGYVSVFNLALRVAREGQRTRLVIVDECEYDPAAWRGLIADYPGLERLFDLVETAYHFDRSLSLEVSPNDAFLATSWWTAHVAHRATRQLKQDRFTFLTQDFEPLFYPAGSRYALAMEAYGFPHRAIFSTELLRDYFRQNRLGVFREDPARGEEDSVGIANAAHAFEVDPSRLRRRGKRKLLFYARPESHAARNMFEIGLLALKTALIRGLLDPQSWEFDGIGGVASAEHLELERGARLRLLPRTSLREYMNLLPGYDLGLSLMLSPHPSMTPLDMAAAGLVTVTNTYATKTRERLVAISPNIVAVEPTVEGVTAGLGEAASRVGQVEARVAGARLNWAMTWDETFDAETMAKIRRFVSSGGPGDAYSGSDDAALQRPEPQPAQVFGTSDLIPSPPRDLLAFAGAGSPEDYRQVGEEFLRHFVKLAQLTPESRVLDIGCGPGRMAVPLAGFLRGGSYDGFDVDERCIQWCEAEISSRHSNFRFWHSDVQNDLYSPEAQVLASRYRFPFEDAAFDLVFLGSVFTHLLPEDMNHYLDEIARVLKPGGRCLATLLVMNAESKGLIGAGKSALPVRYDHGVYHVADESRPEKILGYEEEYVLGCFARVGLSLEPPIHYGIWCGRTVGLSFHDILVTVKA